MHRSAAAVLLAIPVFAGLALLPAESRADRVEVLLQRERNGEASVLVLRQEFDMVHGFDQYFLEEYAAPANRRTSRLELGGESRALLVKAGQYEMYMKQVERAREEALAGFRKKGYEAVCGAVRPDPAPDRLSLPWGDGRFELSVKYGGRDAVLLAWKAGDGDVREYGLMRFPKVEEGVEIPRRVVAGAALLSGGHMLAVVLRSHRFPSPEHSAEEALFFYPLGRASKRLGFRLPLEGGACPGQEGEGGGRR